MSAVTLMILVIFGCIVLGVIISEAPVQKETTPFEVIIRPTKPKVVVKEVIKYVDRPVVAPKQARSAPPKKVVDKPDRTAYNEAKAALVGMGYRASSVKALLDSIGPCDTAETYIKKALTRRT
jgi:hypothetical protein